MVGIRRLHSFGSKIWSHIFTKTKRLFCFNLPENQRLSQTFTALIPINFRFVFSCFILKITLRLLTLNVVASLPHYTVLIPFNFAAWPSTWLLVSLVWCTYSFYWTMYLHVLMGIVVAVVTNIVLLPLIFTLPSSSITWCWMLPNISRYCYVCIYIYIYIRYINLLFCWARTYIYSRLCCVPDRVIILGVFKWQYTSIKKWTNSWLVDEWGTWNILWACEM
jgi:hypothetical protein